QEHSGTTEERHAGTTEEGHSGTTEEEDMGTTEERHAGTQGFKSMDHESRIDAIRSDSRRRETMDGLGQVIVMAIIIFIFIGIAAWMFLQ
ncbi:MAG: hypothetical protein ACPL2N_04660, partial [Candidatus Cryosericum sp.]